MTTVYVRIVAKAFAGSRTYWFKKIADISSTEERAKEMLYVWKDILEEGCANIEPFTPEDVPDAKDGIAITVKNVVYHSWIEEHRLL